MILHNVNKLLFIINKTYQQLVFIKFSVGGERPLAAGQGGSVHMKSKLLLRAYLKLWQY